MSESEPTAPIARRFRVALSFPGERRDYVRAVAEKLAEALGRDTVLYDEYLAAELARPDLDLYLGALYRDQSDLLVPFLCADYAGKKWCNLEWRQLRDIMFALEGDRVMPLRFDDTNIPGMLAIDGFIYLDGRAPERVAELILERLRTEADFSYGSAASTTIVPASSPVYWNVPYGRNPFFTGRDEMLALIRSGLEATGRAALTQVLAGMGGIGKTQIAIEYAYRHRQVYRDIMWVAADTEITIRTSMVSIATELGLHTPTDRDQSRAIEALKKWLDTSSQWLLIFDNADHPALLKPYLPLAPCGHILLTTRAHVLDSVGVAKPLDVAEMPLDEAVMFLQARTGRPTVSAPEWSAAANLASGLGCLPLALEQAAAFITAHDATFAGYWASYRMRELDLLNESEPVAGDYPRSVATTWAMNFSEVRSANQASSDVLSASAFLQPESIPVELFINGGSELGDAIAAAAASDDPLAGDKLLAPLTKYSLIRRDVGSRTFTVHRLVQAAVRTSLGNETCRQWALRATRALNRIFPSGSYDTWVQCDRLLAHGVAVAALADKFGFSVEDSGDVINGVACYLRMRGDYAEAERIHLQSVRLREGESGEGNEEVATALNNLAIVYTDRFEFSKAEPLLVRALEIGQYARGLGSDELSLAMNNLGLCYVRMRRYAEAKPLLEQALAIEGRSSQREDCFYATILNNLAELELGFENLDEANRLGREGLNLRESIGNPEKLGRSYVTMAMVCALRGEHEAAEEFFIKALRNREDVYGLDHPELLLTLRRYSEWLKTRGRADEGVALDVRIGLICGHYRISISAV